MGLITIEGGGFKKIDGFNLKFQKGSGSHLVVSILRQSTKPLSIKEISYKIKKTKAGNNLINRGKVKNVEKRVMKVVEWLSSKELINKDMGKIELV